MANFLQIEHIHIRLAGHFHTVGNRAFPVAALKIWNSLLDDVVFSANFYLLPPTETVLFRVSFSDSILQQFFH